MSISGPGHPAFHGVRFASNFRRTYNDVFNPEENIGYGAYPYPSITRKPDRHVMDTIRQFVRPGERVLELGCNAGANLLPLAREGYRTFGLDLSDPALTTLRHQARQDGLQHNLTAAKYDFAESGDLPPEWTARYGDLKGTFKAIFAVHTLSHLSSPKLVESMQKLKDYLAPGGVFIVTIIDPAVEKPRIVSLFSLLQPRYLGLDAEGIQKKKCSQGFVEHDNETVMTAFKGLKLQKRFSRPFNKGQDELIYSLPFESLKWMVFRKP